MRGRGIIAARPTLGLFAKVEVGHADLGAVVLGTILFPAAVAQLTFDEDHVAFLAVLGNGLATAAPGLDVVPLGVLLEVAGRVFVFATGGDGEGGDGLVVVEALGLGVSAEAAVEGDGVHIRLIGKVEVDRVCG